MSPLVMGMSIFLTWKLSKTDWQASCLWEKSLNSFQVFVMKEGQSKKSSWNTVSTKIKAYQTHYLRVLVVSYRNILVVSSKY